MNRTRSRNNRTSHADGDPPPTPVSSLLFLAGWMGIAAGLFLIPLTVQLFQKPSSNGLTGYYYNGPILDGVPSFVKVDPSINFDWSKGSPIFAQEPFGVHWKGFVDIPQDGFYVFGLISDDESELFIHQQNVIRYHPGDLLKFRPSPTLHLKKGLVPIEVTWLNQAFGSRIELTWEPEPNIREIIPSRYLRPLAGGAR